MRWWIRRLLVIAAIAAPVLLIAAAFALVLTLRASLPRTSGEVTVRELQGAVEVDRDSRGVPVIRAGSGRFEDVARAQGFVHAQERFFQMDLMRRSASARLAELIGSAGVALDLASCGYGWRERASSYLASLPTEHQAWLRAYADGVNAGLGDLGARPPEYVVLMSSPEPWKPEDSVLCALSMHKNLSFGAEFEWRREAMRAVLGAEITEFLMTHTSRWDTPIDDEPGDPDGPAPIPGDEAIAAARSRSQEFTKKRMSESTPEAPIVPRGSNNWAVDGTRTGDGRAILANDMHLGHMVPTTWFHIQLEWAGNRIVGVSLPGVPGIVAGSNGRVAWGFTNVTGDFEDWVIVEPDPADPKKYLVPGGSEPFTQEVETIAVRWRSSGEARAFQTTRWGRILRRDSAGRGLVLRWPALDPDRTNLNILNMISAESLEEGIAAARSWWGPPQNVMIAAADGRIAMVVSGWIPARRGFDGRYPASWAAEGTGWDGPLPEENRPVFIGGYDGVLFSANSRTMNPEQAVLIGTEWSLGERGRRISELLRRPGAFTEKDLLNIQLDTRVELFDLYRDLILEIVPENEPDSLLRAGRNAAASWNGRADIDQAGFGVLDRFQRALRRSLLLGVADLTKEADPGYSYFWFADDEPLRRLIEERPTHWLPEDHEDWLSFLRATLTSVMAQPRPDGVPLGAVSWGELNATRIRHPLSLAVPQLGGLLDMPREPQAGHGSAIRVQSPGFGASERLVVSPGHEEDGILHMPCGQSGHFLSAHYRDGQGAWLAGSARPLLSQTASSGFRLLPEQKTP